jgi:hypothetical protein
MTNVSARLPDHALGSRKRNGQWHPGCLAAYYIPILKDKSSPYVVFHGQEAKKRVMQR